MTASRTLGKMRGIPEQDLITIDEIHLLIHTAMAAGLTGDRREGSVEMILEAADYSLQDLWKFPRNQEMHTLVKKFRFRKEWHGRKFQCVSTGETVVIDALNLNETDTIQVGEGFVDVGRYQAYFRTVGCAEVTL